MPSCSVIGDNVYIGPGAKICGAMTVESNCVLATTAALHRPIEREGMLIAWVPAEVIEPIDITTVTHHLG